MEDFKEFYLEQLKNKYSQLKVVESEEAKAKLSHLEEIIGHTLPIAYKEFMMLDLPTSVSVLKGTDYTFKHNEDLMLTKYAKDLLAEHNLSPLDKNTFVFAMHQGYIFFYFFLDQGDDPAVWMFSEVDKLHIKKFNSFTEFIKQQISD